MAILLLLWPQNFFTLEQRKPLLSLQQAHGYPKLRAHFIFKTHFSGGRESSLTSASQGIWDSKMVRATAQNDTNWGKSLKTLSRTTCARSECPLLKQERVSCGFSALLTLHTHKLSLYSQDSEEREAKVDAASLSSLHLGKLLRQTFPSQPFFLSAHSSLFPSSCTLSLVQCLIVVWKCPTDVFTCVLSLSTTWMQVPWGLGLGLSCSWLNP